MVREAVIALDVGGSLVKAALVASDGTLRHAQVSETGARGGAEAVLDHLAGVIGTLRDQAARDDTAVVAVGVALPGLVDSERGRVVEAANLGWSDVPAGAMLSARTGERLHIAHDVRMAAFAERALGAASGHDDVLLITVGTGIGGALLLNGDIHLGAHHRAAELGHLPVAGLHETCPCGRIGCVELVASCRAIERRYAQRTGVSSDVATIVTRAAHGEAAASLVWDSAVDALAGAIDSAVVFFDPELVVVGGGIVALPSDLIDRLNRRVRAAERWQPAATVTAAALGPWAGCVGTGLWAWSRAVDTAPLAVEASA